jgi:hypothetical protein
MCVCVCVTVCVCADLGRSSGSENAKRGLNGYTHDRVLVEREVDPGNPPACGVLPIPQRGPERERRRARAQVFHHNLVMFCASVCFFFVAKERKEKYGDDQK